MPSQSSRAPLWIHCSMMLSVSAQVEPGADAGWPGPKAGSDVDVRRSLVSKNEPAASPGFTSRSPVTLPRRFAAGAFTSVAYGWPTKLGPLCTAGESCAWQFSWPTPHPTWRSRELMLENVGVRIGQLRVPSMQAPLAQNADAPQSASMAHCTGLTPPMQANAAAATMSARPTIASNVTGPARLSTGVSLRT